MNPEKRSYTWRQGGSASRLKQSRLDYWIVSAHMLYDLVDIKPSTGSDHSLIDINFYKKIATDRGPSFWRFNANLLHDKVYVEQIKQKYNTVLIKYKDELDLGLKWDLIKMELRTATISYSKLKQRKNEQIYTML
jgi:hypothetical protein